MRLVTIIALIGIAALAGCGGGGSGAGDTLVSADSEGKDAAAEDVGLPDIQEEMKKSCSDNLVIEVFGLLEGVTLETGKEYTVQARIYDSFFKKEVPGENVVFSLVGAGDAQLLSTEAVTNEFGVAAVQLATGEISGVDYTLSVANECAGAASLTFMTGEPQQGDLVVHVTLSQEVIDMGETISLEVYLDQYSTLCAAADFADPKGALTPIPDGADTVTLTDVLSGPSYIVVVIGVDAVGQHVAAGCQEGINVAPDMTAETTVTLNPISIAPQGFYDVSFPVAFKDLLQGKWVDPAQLLETMTANLAGDISEAINQDLLPWYEEGIPEDCGAALAQIESDVAGALAGLPDAKVTKLAQDSNALLESLLESVTINAELQLDPAGDPWACNATLDVKSAKFAGQPECAPGCTDYTHDLFDLGEVHLQVSEAQFEFTAQGADGFIMNQFQLALSPGRFLLFAFVNIAMPEAGLDNSVDKMFNSLVDCEQLVKDIDETTMACLKFHAAQVDPQKSCENVMKELKTRFYAEFAPLTAPQHLQTSGNGKILDDDKDMKADGLDGLLVGDYMHGGLTVGPFQFPLTGVKK